MAGKVSRALRPRGFGRASEEPYRRRTSDGLRIVVAVGALVWISLHIDDVSPVQRDVFQAVNDLPGGLLPAARVLNSLAALWAASLVVAAALVARRWRLARDLLIAGALGWVVARGLGLGLGSGLRHHVGAVFRARETPSFPSVRVALLCAVIATAAPYVTRLVRLLGSLTVALLVPTELYLGTALPRDLLAALLLGWGLAAGVHLAFGSPGGRPTTAQVQATLEELGVQAVHDVRLAPVQPATTLMLAEDDQGALQIKVLGRDERDARLLAKLWRYVSYRDSGPALFLTRTQEVEHEAFVALLAHSRGARVPELVAVGTGGPGTTVLVQRPPPGTPMAELPAEQLTDELLDAVWQQAGLLHAAGVVHGHLNTARVLVDGDAVALVGLEAAQTPAPVGPRAFDVAELLATTAARVGDRRAIDAAVRSVDREVLVGCLPLLQPGALTRQGRHLAGRQLGHDLGTLRSELAEELETAEPQLEQLRRASRSSIALTAGTVVGVTALLAQVSDPTTLLHAVERARTGPLTVAVAASLATAVGYAIQTAGSVRARLPLLSNLRLQIAGPFANLALPVGSQALQIRWLQRHGLDATTAITATGLVTLGASLGVQLAVFGLATLLSPRRLDLQLLPHGAVPTLLRDGGAALLVASVVVAAVPALRRRFIPFVVQSATTVWDVLRSPRQMSLLVVGNVVTIALQGVSLQLCLLSLGYSSSIWTLLAINIATSTIAGLVPIPGGTTAVSSIGLSGGLIAAGIPTAPAVAVVLVNQLVANYIPAIPGWVALRSLVTHQEI